MRSLWKHTAHLLQSNKESRYLFAQHSLGISSFAGKRGKSTLFLYLTGRYLAFLVLRAKGRQKPIFFFICLADLRHFAFGVGWDV